jgi:multidrug transporter EmrE-like cation transporter
MSGLLPYYVALLAGILLGVMGQILLKTGALRSVDMVTQFLNPFTMFGFFVYGLAAICYVIAIKRIPISLAFPTVSLSYVAVALVAHIVWGEPLGLPQLAGIALISCGVLLLHHT